MMFAYGCLLDIEGCFFIAYVYLFSFLFILNRSKRLTALH